MGRSFTPTHRVEYTVVIAIDSDGDWTTPRFTDAAWSRDRKFGGGAIRGPAALTDLERHVTAFEASFAPGGANDHVYPDKTVRLLTTRLVRQSDGAIVAEHKTRQGGF